MGVEQPHQFLYPEEPVPLGPQDSMYLTMPRDRGADLKSLLARPTVQGEQPARGNSVDCSAAGW